jgi:hypothetical protein
LGSINENVQLGQQKPVLLPNCTDHVPVISICRTLSHVACRMSSMPHLLYSLLSTPCSAPLLSTPCSLLPTFYSMLYPVYRYLVPFTASSMHGPIAYRACCYYVRYKTASLIHEHCTEETTEQRSKSDRAVHNRTIPSTASNNSLNSSSSDRTGAMVGGTGLEPVTSAMSTQRSNR